MTFQLMLFPEFKEKAVTLSYDDELRFDIKLIEIMKKYGLKGTFNLNSRCLSHENRVNDDWLRLSATCHHKCPRLMELVDKFLQDAPNGYFWQRSPKLFYLWGHSYEFNNDNNWDVIEKFAEKIGNRDDVWYATNGEIYAYVEAYKSLKFSVGGGCVYNPSGIDVFIRTTQNEKYLVPAGKIIRIKN